MLLAIILANGQILERLIHHCPLIQLHTLPFRFARVALELQAILGVVPLLTGMVQGAVARRALCIGICLGSSALARALKLVSRLVHIGWQSRLAALEQVVSLAALSKDHSSALTIANAVPLDCSLFLFKCLDIVRGLLLLLVYVSSQIEAIMTS